MPDPIAIKILKDENGEQFCPVTHISAVGGSPESSTNKVTSLSNESTDTQYPSAKCVYDAVQGVGGAGTLDTTATTAQSTNASESLGGSVTLHKISKTGAYGDLLGAPTNVSDFVNDAGYTTNTGTITSVKMNGSTVASSGEADLGTVVTSETQLSKGTTTGDGNAVTDISVSGHQITLTKGSTFLTSFTETDPVFSASAAAGITSSDITAWNGMYTKPSTGIPASDLASGVIPTVPTISTDIDADATSDVKTTSPKAVKTFVENKGYTTNTGTVTGVTVGTTAYTPTNGVVTIPAYPSVPVTDVTVGGTSVVSSGTAAVPAIPDAVEANPTVPSGTTPTDLQNLKIGNNYYGIPTPSSSLDDLSDVNLGTPANGDVLTYDSTSGKWIADEPQGGELSTDVVTDKASNAKASTPKSVYDFVKPASQSSQPVGGMEPGVLYNLSGLTGNVTITLATPTDASVANEYWFSFDTSSTAPTITWPSSVTWSGNCIDNYGAPEIVASKHYEVSIVNNYGIIVEF